MLRRFRPGDVDSALTFAATRGGQAAAKVLRNVAPVGTSGRRSQFYRRNGLGHGTFRKSVKSSKIRGRTGGLNVQGRTVGVVIGPQGRNGFTRAWLELGTSGPGRHRQAGTNWVEHAAPIAFAVAQRESEASLGAYARV